MKSSNISAKHILVIHGPNLNLLGKREPEIYGKTTLNDINKKLHEIAHAAKAKLDVLQSNSEGILIDRIQLAMQDGTDFIIINPAGLTHTSIALRDAIAATGLPFIEIHLSNIYAREPYRQKSFFSDLAIGVISGLGAKGYELALQYALTKQ
ncbi:type II 3-dehydroquinate dehydratase [Nitrosomonas sp.]|uniref:type II 3-dehydroquinate dehydratase n=1 Tax=Nitrosomonas sp. TaxID=42353 RepID=UPI0026087CAA|nr:type II 3-dehydroquinate dehydratase [Nitrosomonas sp.]MCW5600766.1 type II 3-dehydroquinate dehydratase [Nitrosomonas sp.]